MKNSFGIYQLLVTLLKAAPKPLTCVELFDNEEVKRLAGEVNRVSDYLGHLYRRGYLGREPSRGVGAARWAYFWKDANLAIPPQRTAAPRLQLVNMQEQTRTQAVLAAAARGVVVDKAELQVIDRGNEVVLELPAITITIRLKQ